MVLVGPLKTGGKKSVSVKFMCASMGATTTVLHISKVR